MFVSIVVASMIQAAQGKTVAIISLYKQSLLVLRRYVQALRKIEEILRECGRREEMKEVTAASPEGVQGSNFDVAH